MKKKCLLSLFAVCFAVFSMVVVEEARAQNPDINKDGVVDCYDIDELSRRIALRCEPIQGVIPCGDWNRDGCEDKGYDSFFYTDCLLYTSPSPRDQRGSRMPSSA